MKLKAILAGLTLAGLCGTAYAGDYFPPERIHCKSTQAGKMICEGFNHQYLVEDTFTADLTDKDEVFNFKSGSAYFDTRTSQSTVFFSYHNAGDRGVKLRSATVSIRPDFERSGWKKVTEDLYVCQSGYMTCPITNLPAVSQK